MDKDQLIVDAALAAVRKLGLTAKLVQRKATKGAAAADAIVQIAHGERQGGAYIVEAKRGVRPGTVGPLIHRIQRLGKDALVVADHITPATAEILRANHVPFIDAAGNAYLEHPGLFIWVTGQKPTLPTIAPTLGRMFHPTGLQVIFTLLCKPVWINLPYRELAQRAGVAHGTVGWVMLDLEQQGFTATLKGKRGTRRFFNREKLLGQWTDAYARQLRPRLLVGRYFIATLEGWKRWPLAEHGALWGEEPAGAILTDHLRPETLTLYAEKMPGLLAARQKFAKEAEPGRTVPVQIRRKFWAFPDDGPKQTTVPPVLVYADLMATGDARCIETAQLVYDAYVARLLEAE